MDKCKDGSKQTPVYEFNMILKKYDYLFLDL